jgi:hypothetical protein
MASLSRALGAIVLLSASLLNVAPARAQDVAIAAKVGTTGLGGGVVVGLTSKINVRSMYGFVPGDPSFNIDDIDFAIGLPSFWLTTVDLYPFGSFHISGGGLWISNDGDLDVVGSFVGRAVDFGGTSYTGAADDRLIGTFSLKSFQPYLGVGIGNPIGTRIGINFDVGIGFGERPTVALDAEGTIANTPVVGTQFQADLDQEAADIEADIPDLLRYYPVLMLSVSIGF